jgi:hypothetical protein
VRDARISDEHKPLKSLESRVTLDVTLGAPQTT